MYAIFRDRGRQHRASQGSTILIDQRPEQTGTEVVFDQVLLVGSETGGDATVGTPTVAGATVRGTVLGEIKGKKIKVFTYKPRKKSSRKRKGHRQRYTRLRIEAIEAGS